MPATEFTTDDDLFGALIGSDELKDALGERYGGTPIDPIKILEESGDDLLEQMKDAMKRKMLQHQQGMMAATEAAMSQGVSDDFTPVIPNENETGPKDKNSETEIENGTGGKLPGEEPEKKQDAIDDSDKNTAQINSNDGESAPSGDDPEVEQALNDFGEDQPEDGAAEMPPEALNDENLVNPEPDTTQQPESRNKKPQQPQAQQSNDDSAPSAQPPEEPSPAPAPEDTTPASNEPQAAAAPTEDQSNPEADEPAPANGEQQPDGEQNPDEKEAQKNEGENRGENEKNDEQPNNQKQAEAQAAENSDGTGPNKKPYNQFDAESPDQNGVQQANDNGQGAEANQPGQNPAQPGGASPNGQTAQGQQAQGQTPPQQPSDVTGSQTREELENEQLKKIDNTINQRMQRIRKKLAPIEKEISKKKLKRAACMMKAGVEYLISLIVAIVGILLCATFFGIPAGLGVLKIAASFFENASLNMAEYGKLGLDIKKKESEMKSDPFIKKERNEIAKLAATARTLVARRRKNNSPKTSNQ